MQTMMEQLAAGGLKTAVKPQQVDLLPKRYGGKVGKLFEKLLSGMNEQEKQWAGERWKELELLGLDGMMEKEIGGLSGGELQTIALAAALVRKADVYFFDEPSSYLDVQQRLTAAAIIRKAAAAGAAVITVEHDLAVADYMADYVHIFYGSPGAYGVVSQNFTVRGGINTYLDGYIKEENMRFRPEPLRFSRAAEKIEQKKVLLEFPAFEKHFPGFSLRAEHGTIHRAEVLGILGPNATGKTTFIRLLAGELTGDNGERFAVPMKLSYKPQRLTISEDGLTVMGYLQEKTGGKINQRLLETLHAGTLLERGMETLSGGELQTVFIIEALSKEHDMLLLDEPSAFLDVEQRLRVAKLLREEAEMREKPIVLIDHDVQFMDAAADRLMVFEGVAGKDGVGRSPVSLREGMNRFLRTVGVTFRRDPDTGRPRANKPLSQLDTEQRESGEYYYAK